MAGIVVTKNQVTRGILVVITIHELVYHLSGKVEKLLEVKNRVIQKCDRASYISLISGACFKADLGFEDKAGCRVFIDQRFGAAEVSLHFHN